MSRPSNEPYNEPYDEHMYTFVVVDADMLRFLAESLAHYQTLLEEDVAAVEADPDLNLVLGEKPTQLLPVKQELARVARAREW